MALLFQQDAEQALCDCEFIESVGLIDAAALLLNRPFLVFKIELQHVLGRPTG